MMLLPLVWGLDFGLGRQYGVETDDGDDDSRKSEMT